MNEQTVREAIQALIERKEMRVGILRAANVEELQAGKRMHNEVIIMELEHGINTLIELEHNLRLCGCPDEAYATKGA